MKNKSHFTFCAFLIICCITLFVDAQEEKRKNIAFDLEIIEYSDKPDADTEHYHLLQLKNNSNKNANFKLSSKWVKCKDEYEDVVRNKFGNIDSEPENNFSKKSNNKDISSLTIELYNEKLNKKLSQISLSPNETIKFYVKIIRENNSEIGQWECSKIIAKQLLGNKKEKTVKKSVIIKSFIPDPNLKGH